MQTIPNLNTHLLNTRGKQYDNDESSFSFLYIECLGNFSKGTGIEKIRCYKLAMRLMEAKSNGNNEVIVDDADIEILKKAIEQMELATTIHAQLILNLGTLEQDTKNER